MSVQSEDIEFRAVDMASPDLKTVNLHLGATVEGSNLKRLTEIIDRHQSDQKWLDKLPEDHRILYASQIAIHKDRGALLEMFRYGGISAQSEGDRVQVQARIKLLDAELTAITERVRNGKN